MLVLRNTLERNFFSAASPISTLTLSPLCPQVECKWWFVSEREVGPCVDQWTRRTRRSRHYSPHRRPSVSSRRGSQNGESKTVQIASLVPKHGSNEHGHITSQQCDSSMQGSSLPRPIPPFCQAGSSNSTSKHSIVTEGLTPMTPLIRDHEL